MVSSTMVTQEQSSGPQSNTLHASGNSVILDADAQSVAGKGHVPKIRKPYTITKQRERWTDEEHKKFLEALKLYGRAWRKIEEHVGSKTAVQIRSHAQKFFSKVVRETNNSNASSSEAVEIPPPRPKRKPMHPYPRKLVVPLRKECSIEQQARCSSPNSSVSEQENQSPTSVLSAVVSETLGTADSITPNGSPSTISSVDAVNQVSNLPCEENGQQDDVHMSQSVPNAPVSVKLELFPNTNPFDKEDSAFGTRVLKLFGKQVVVPYKPSLDMELENPKPMEIEIVNSGNSCNRSNSREASTFDYMDGNTNQVEKPIPLPWWVFFRGMPNNVGVVDKETQREGSCAGSNSESVNAVENTDNNWDAETQSGQCALQSDNENKRLDKKISVDKGMKGFVPYKRCVSERDMQSSTIINDEKQAQRIRLCL